MQLVILFDIFVYPGFKMILSFANIAITIAGTSEFIY